MLIVYLLLGVANTGQGGASLFGFAMLDVPTGRLGDLERMFSFLTSVLKTVLLTKGT